MASRRYRSSGGLYKARDRAYKRQLEYFQWLNTEDEGEPSQPARANLPENPAESPAAVEDFGSDSEAGLVADDDESSNGGFPSEVEELFDEPVPDCPYGNERTFKEALRIWVLETRQTRPATNKLLAILRQYFPDQQLPRDRRTLVGTPVGISKEFSDVGGGQQWVQGIEESLQSYYRNYQPDVGSLDLDIFIDGLPLHDSSKIHFWPVLMQVRNVEDAPVMVVSIFEGEGKPSTAEAYLRPFVSEMNRLMEHGITIGAYHYPVRFGCLIADSPARSFAKGVVQYNSYHGCPKCTVVGTWERGRMSFRYSSPREDRTDKDFRAGAYPKHVKFWTPLMELHDCDLIRDVLTMEGMHLLDNGVMYRLLFIWTNNFPDMKKTLSDEQQRKVSEHWMSLQLPSDFQRKPRDLNCIKLWKASEFKMFLQVGGPVVLKGVLPDAEYQHFMLLFVAVTLLSSDQHRAKWEWANTLLHQFVRDYETVYRPYLVNSNVHNLLHAHDDVVRFGPIPLIAAYRHESTLKDLKSELHSENKSLAQIANRLRELQQIQMATRPRDPAHYVSVQKLGADIITQVRRGMKLRRNFRDQWFLSTTGRVVKYETGTKTGPNLIVQGYMFSQQVPAFSDPYPSSEINIHSANLDDLNESLLVSFSPDQILCKVSAVQCANGTDVWFIPLQHTYLPIPAPPLSEDDVDLD